MYSLFALLTGFLTAAAFVAGARRASSIAAAEGVKLHSRPPYHGSFLALCCVAPLLVILVLKLAAEPLLLQRLTLEGIERDLLSRYGGPSLLYLQIKNMASGSFGAADSALLEAAVSRYTILSFWSDTVAAAAAACAAAAGWRYGWRRIALDFAARAAVERALRLGTLCCAAFAIVITAGIVFSLIFESIRFFSIVPLGEFLFGTRWSPQTAIRPDQVASSGSFGAIPLFAGTLLIGSIALGVAVPVGLLSAVYLSEYARRSTRRALKPALEILAGIPTVVYGFFAALTVAPLLRQAGAHLGMDVSSESALAAGLVMGVMIIPFVSSLSDDVLHAVPRSLRDGALALGATRSETITQVVLPAALPGIVGAVLLAMSRAVGETMIVVMAAGLAANLTLNPFDNVTTVTVQIVTLLVGDQEFDSAKTLSAFALGLTLFIVTLILNLIALWVVKRFREKYD